jgi:hypothetical protein
MTLQRSTVELAQNVNNTLKYTFPNTFNLTNPFKISISPKNSTIEFAKSIQSSKFISSNLTGQNSTNSLVSNSLNGK